MPSVSNQFQLEELPKRLPLVQTAENRSSQFTKDAQLVNCYAEKDLHTGDYTVYKRIGFSAPVYTHAGTTGRGAALWSSLGGGGVFFIFNGVVYRNNGVIGAIVNRAAKHHFQLMDKSGAAGKLVFGDGADAYYTDGAVVTHIVDADFPTAFVPGWAYLDGTLYVMDFKGNIQGSDIEDPSAWNALNVIQARSEPGLGVALTKHLTYVVALKESSTEAFYNAGNLTGSPLSRVEGAFSNYGCYLGESVQSTDGTTIWVTSNNTTSPQIVRMDGLRISVVSTPAIDRLLDGIDLSSAILSWIFKHNGHRFYAFTSVGSNLTIVYDIDQNLWYRWTDASGNALNIVDIFPDNTVVNGRQLAQGRLDGNISIVDSCFNYPTDNGAIVPVDIYTPRFDAGVDRRKVLSMMHFDGDQVTGSTLRVRYSDDDYQNWSNFREVNMGNKRPILSNCGTFYRRAWHIQHKSATAMRLKNVDLQFSLGTL